MSRPSRLPLAGTIRYERAREPATFYMTAPGAFFTAALAECPATDGRAVQHVGMGTRGAFEVAEIPSDRWDLALDLLRDGGHMLVLPGEVPVGLQRYSGWPKADGCVHVSIFTGAEPSAVSLEMAQHDVDRGLATVRAAEEADVRLSRLFDKHGVVFEYVYDYGHGAVRIGDVDEVGTVALL